MEELKQYLEKQQTKWLHILNERYETDGGTPLEDYAKGHLAAYTEILSYLKKQEKPDERLTEEARRIRKEILTNDGSTQQEGAYN